jgi:hypothetical protein
MNSEQILEKEGEVRTLPIKITQELVKILDSDDSVLSLLMGSIVKDLEDPSSELRFTSKDVEAVRNHSFVIRKSAMMIFIDEWSTMGKSRPKLRHLLGILINCQLFRAADYLANLIRGESPPERPRVGPAARVEIDLDIEEVVNGLEYPFSGSEVNRNKPKAKPEIVAPNMNFPSRSTNNGNGSLPLIPIPSTRSARFTNSTIFATSPSAAVIPSMNPSISDLMKFPSEASRQASDNLLPAFSALQVSEQIPMTVNSDRIVTEPQENIPAFSGLMANESTPLPSSELPAVLMGNSQISSASNIPMFSALINGESTSQRIQMSTQSTINSSDSE